MTSSPQTEERQDCQYNYDSADEPNNVVHDPYLQVIDGIMNAHRESFVPMTRQRRSMSTAEFAT
jgi:hypothetical protein